MPYGWEHIRIPYHSRQAGRAGKETQMAPIQHSFLSQIHEVVLLFWRKGNEGQGEGPPVLFYNESRGREMEFPPKMLSIYFIFANLIGCVLP